MALQRENPLTLKSAADNFQLLASTSGRLKRYLDSLQIPGIEELKSDFQSDKPEINIKIDREKANREGISTQSIGRVLGTAVYGAEVSRFRDENDDYPIQLRVRQDQRNDVNTLMNLPITFQDMSKNGQVTTGTAVRDCDCRIFEQLRWYQTDRSKKNGHTVVKRAGRF